MKYVIKIIFDNLLDIRFNLFLYGLLKCFNLFDIVVIFSGIEIVRELIKVGVEVN